jgi:hypothetical protein
LSPQVVLGVAEVKVDVLCTADFMQRLHALQPIETDEKAPSYSSTAKGSGVESSSGGGAATSGERQQRPRVDRLFKDPAEQLRHFVKVLRDVDQMLVQVRGCCYCS